MRSNAHSGPKTNVEWFKFYLYRDHEFLALETRFNDWLETSFSEDARIVLELTCSRDCSLKTQLDERLGYCEGVEIIETTAEIFEVPEHVVEYGFIKHPEYRGVANERRPHVTTSQYSPISIGKNELVIKVFANTRIEDIEDVWPVIEHIQKEMAGYVPKLQTTSQYALIYAIYKQRLRGKDRRRIPFSRLFKMYQDNELPGYEGSTTQYKSADHLADHYRRYLPKTSRM